MSLCGWKLKACSWLVFVGFCCSLGRLVVFAHFRSGSISKRFLLWRTHRRRRRNSKRGPRNCQRHKGTSSEETCYWRLQANRTHTQAVGRTPRMIEPNQKPPSQGGGVRQVKQNPGPCTAPVRNLTSWRVPSAAESGRIQHFFFWKRAPQRTAPRPTDRPSTRPALEGIY